MAFNDDEKPTDSHAASTTGLVLMKTPAYSKDETRLTADAVTVVLELKATASTAVREGLDLVAVLDVSGSMAGTKLQSMKKGMHLVLTKLTPVDRLSIVAFSNSATRHCPLRSMTEAAKTELRAIVDGLVARGGTNIESGMDTALAIFAGRATTRARTANVFLMSDGQQNDGTDARWAEPGEVGVYTFGFGKDADHRLLSDIAEKSNGGTFSSVLDGGNVSVPFSQLLGGLLTVVAQDVQLTLTPQMDDPRELDTMSVAPGTGYAQLTDEDTDVITIHFGDLFSGEVRKVVLNLTLLDSDDTAKHDARLCEVHHSYTSQEGVQAETPQDIIVYRVPNPSSFVGNALPWDPEIARRQHASAIYEARVLADGNNLDEARRKLADALVLNGGRKMFGDEMRQLLVLMESQELYDAEGRPYALASESSHGRQRYAARGGDMDADRLFATPRMDAYLQQAKRFEGYPTTTTTTTTTLMESDALASETSHGYASAVGADMDADLQEGNNEQLEEGYHPTTAPLLSADEDLKKEMAANPLAGLTAISAPLTFHINAATVALKEIEKVLARTAT